MPPVKLHIQLPAYVRLALWQVTEPEAWYRAALPWPEEDLAEFEAVKGPRRLESMAARLALHQLTGAETIWPLKKDAHSKPRFPKQMDWHCSLSHSHGLAAAVLSQQHCGVDLQRYTDRMDVLAHKFVNPHEAQLLEAGGTDLRTMHLHQIWTAKEAMYKVYGRKSLDFKAHMFVHGLGAVSTGYIRKGDVELACRLYFQWLELTDLGRWAICVAVTDS